MTTMKMTMMISIITAKRVSVLMTMATLLQIKIATMMRQIQISQQWRW